MSVDLLVLSSSTCTAVMPSPYLGMLEKVCLLSRPQPQQVATDVALRVSICLAKPYLAGVPSLL